MLENVRIQGFRSCRDVRLDVNTPLIALLGRNGAGKTNVLRAIDWLARTASTLEAPRLEFPLHGNETIKVSIEMALGGDRYRFAVTRRTSIDASAPVSPRLSLEETLSVYQDGNWVALFERAAEKISVPGRAEPYRVGSASAALPSLAALLPPSDALLVRVRTILNFFSAIKYYPLEEPMDQVGGIESFPMVLSESFKQWRAGGSVGENPFHMELLRLFLEDPQRFEELKALLEPDGLGILKSMAVEAMPGGTAPPLLYMIQLAPIDSGEGQNFGYPELSAGTRRLVRLLMALICDESAVMLVEQPEDSIHSGLTAKLLGHLASYSEGRVVVMTTHASSMMDALPPEAIRLVTMERGVTTLRPLSEEELIAAREFLDSEGTLSDFVESVQD